MRPSDARLIGAAIFLAVLAAVFWRAERASPAKETRATHALAEAPAPPELAARSSAPLPAAAIEEPGARSPERVAEIPSLRGTEVDGALETDADGRFRATGRAVRLFEYFLLGEGEVAPETIRAHVAEEAARRLDGAEAARAVALFDRYVAYRHADPPRPSESAARDPAHILAATHAARVAAFGEADARALFGDDEATASAEVAESAARLSGAAVPPGAVEDLPPDIQELHARRAARAAAVAALVAARR